MSAYVVFQLYFAKTEACSSRTVSLRQLSFLYNLLRECMFQIWRTLAKKIWMCQQYFKVEFYIIRYCVKVDGMSCNDSESNADCLFAP